ncbi:hypothetical protein [Mesorhizobium sp.]|nr:hypothetical protein [Mesorhizobium sp.]
MAALDALRRRVAIQSSAIVEHDDRLVVGARRLRCLAVLGGIIGG